MASADEAFALSFVYRPTTTRAWTSNTANTNTNSHNNNKDFSRILNSNNEDTESAASKKGRRETVCALVVAFFEIVVSLTGLTYIMVGMYNYPNYNPHRILHDEIVMEARKHFPENPERVPEALLFLDFFSFLTELFFAVILFVGVLQKQGGKVRCWLITVLTYTIVITGIVIGLIIGGVNSSNMSNHNNNDDPPPPYPHDEENPPSYYFHQQQQHQQSSSTSSTATNQNELNDQNQLRAISAIPFL